MKPKPKWHGTKGGKIILYLGSIRFAIPLLILTAGSLMYGTWIESTIGAKEAGQTVYGSWWFIALMFLICLTLIFAVVTRYPWRKKHTGFIIVHAALITVIVSGFVTFYTKVEGEMALNEGMISNSLRTGSNEIQILRHDAGEFKLLDSAVVDGLGAVRVNGFDIEILDQWANTTQKTVVADDGPNKLHAIEVRFDDEQGDGYWIGQLRENETPPMLHGIEIRVLPEGKTWTPPSNDDQSKPIFRRAQSDQHIDVGQDGDSLGDGWKIESAQYFEHAIVDSDGLAEGEASRDNPAIQVILINEDGSRERHIAFDRFRGSINKKQLAGETFSEFVLEYQGEGLERPVLVVTRNGEQATAQVIVPGMQTSEYSLDGSGPWTLTIDEHTCTILHEYANARGTTELVEAPEAAENMPAIRLLVHAPKSTNVGQDAQVKPITIPWGQRSVIQIADQFYGIGYNPTTVDVPFQLELVDFRKEDYPGSEMAMAYESDVRFTDADGNTHEQTISMNKPLKYNGWKIYQAGFVGSDVSIFQVTKDPGLKAMYIGCLGVCFGIFVMYYSKSYSHGHPGMPKVFASGTNTRTTTHATAQLTPDNADTDPIRNSNNGVSPARSKLEGEVCADPSPISRTHNADGHLRKKGRGRSHRAHKVG